MKKISILINKEAQNLGLYYGYWNWFLYFKQELNDLGFKVEFHRKISSKYLEADYLFLNSRSFSTLDDYVNLTKLEKIKKINNNIYWFDMRDSAGTTQFEVLPFVKKYVKKQLYKDKSLYVKNLYGGRYYTDFYHNKFNINDKKQYDQKKLDINLSSKVILGWNLGVAQIFDHSTFSKLDYWQEYIRFKFFNKKKYSMILDFNNNNLNKIDIICLMNKNFARNTVGYQRNRINDFLKNSNYKNCLYNKRLNKKNYLKNLKNSKLSLGSFGWGEICYREFEAIRCGAAFTTADMSNIETWPNIYLKNETYIPYSLDFSDISEVINEILNNNELRTKLIKNSQEILINTHNEIGKKYFLDKILEILK
tara:strand:- start:1172 stop:2266 length:1095 start_codon:yes stop_codon:yes gene_type:complete